jgi:propionyl-CoA carboxylase alpha chain
VNTRIQVEHPVTEMVLGLDLVRMQIEVAEGSPMKTIDAPQGHAIEARLYAEDAANGFVPSAGKILKWRAPEGVRVESGIEAGSEVGIQYDPMLAKIIAHGATREAAIRKLTHALDGTTIHGVTTNREFLIRVLQHPDFQRGCVDTGFSISYQPDRGGEPVAKAALDAYLEYRRVTERNILPSIPANFRNNPFYPRQSAAKLISAEPGHVRVEIDGGQYAFDVSEDALRYWVGNHTFPRVSRYPSSESAASGESASSPMPGQVLRILVETGREVRAGEPLVVLEAMKMEQTIRAHAHGVVESILVKPGQVVAPGETLVEIRAKEQV